MRGYDSYCGGYLFFYGRHFSTDILHTMTVTIYNPQKENNSDKPKHLSKSQKQKKSRKNKAQKQARRIQRLTPNPKIIVKDGKTYIK